MTDAEIIAVLRAKNLPDDITDAQITSAIAQVILFLREAWPLDTYGTFQTVDDQAVYDVFSATVVPATQQGVLAGGIMVIELLGNPDTLSDEGNVFGLAPLLQAGGWEFGLPYNRYSFNTPGDMTLWATNWDVFKKYCSTLHWEQVSTVPGSPIRLMPVPDCVKIVFVRYTKNRTDAEIRNTYPAMFLLFVEAYLYNALANHLSLSAGVKIGELDDRGNRHNHWFQLSRFRQDEASALLAAYQTQMTSPGTRS